MGEAGGEAPAELLLLLLLLFEEFDKAPKLLCRPLPLPAALLSALKLSMREEQRLES